MYQLRNDAGMGEMWLFLYILVIFDIPADLKATSILSSVLVIFDVYFLFPFKYTPRSRIMDKSELNLNWAEFLYKYWETLCILTVDLV